jgi:hypothetical protein
MGFYTLITAIILPMLMNTILNTCIFIHVRRSSRRLQPQGVSAITGGTNQPQARISRRDIHLLKQMVFTFAMFIIGWTPAFVINTVNVIIFVDFVIAIASVYLSAVCLLALMINLLLCNRDIRQYGVDLIRRCFHCQY